LLDRQDKHLSKVIFNFFVSLFQAVFLELTRLQYEIRESDKAQTLNSDACKFDAEGEKDKSNFDFRPDRLRDHFTLWNIPRPSPHSPP